MDQGHIKRPVTFISVQQLRGLAALGVIVVHVGVQLGRMGYTGPWPNVLACGVDVFFVISGFIMWVVTHGRQTSPPRFMLHRLVRIVPLYWLVTGFALCVLLLNGDLMQTSRLDWDHVLKSFLFIPAVHPTKLDVMEPLVFAGWTLNYEMLFYTLFAATLLVRDTIRLPLALGLLLALSSVRLLEPQPLGIVWFYSSEIVLEFGLGLLAGAVVTSVPALPRRLGAALLTAGSLALLASAFLADGSVSRLLMWGLPAFGIVLGAALTEQHGYFLRSALLHGMGDASYATYLTHGAVLSAFAQAWRSVWPEANPLNWLLFGTAAVLVCCAAGEAVYRSVDRPLTAALRSPRKRLRASVGAAAP